MASISDQIQILDYIQATRKAEKHLSNRQAAGESGLDGELSSLNADITYSYADLAEAMSVPVVDATNFVLGLSAA